MRILDVTKSTAQADIDKARAIVIAEISHPSKVVMIIRGSSPEVGQFADRANGRAVAFPFREVLWIKNAAIFETGQESALFTNHGTACAVVLDLNDQPAAWLKTSDGAYQVEKAFLKAQAVK